MVLLIILLVILFLLFYPLKIRADARYEEEDWQGRAVLYPFFCIPWIKIVLWDSNKEKKEKPAKKEKEKKKKKQTTEENAGETETKKKKNSLLRNLKNRSLEELISMSLELLKSANRGIRRLRIGLSFGYALENPATMGAITAGIYSVVSCFMGGLHKSRWRIGIYPQWETFHTMAFVQGRATICLFDALYICVGMMKTGIKLLLKKQGGNKDVTSH